MHRKSREKQMQKKRAESFVFLRKKSIFHEEIWPDQHVGVPVWAAEGNGNVDYTK